MRMIETSPDDFYVSNRNKIRYSYDHTAFQVIITIFVTLAALFSLIPLTITLINSMKIDDAVAKNIFSLPDLANLGSAIIKNYSNAWGQIGTFFYKTIIVSLIGAILETAIGASLAYILSFKEFYFKNAVFMLFIAVLLIPSIIGFPILVPLVRDTFGLGDTYFGFLLAIVGGGQVGAMFLFRTFFGQQPKSLYESAKIEGANDFYIFFNITIPLSLPILLYYFVGAFSGIYNEYLWASLILDGNITLMTKMYALVDSQTIKYGSMYAMYIISSLPLVVTTFISMKYFSGGEFASGMKL